MELQKCMIELAKAKGPSAIEIKSRNNVLPIHARYRNITSSTSQCVEEKLRTRKSFTSAYQVNEMNEQNHSMIEYSQCVHTITNLK